MSGGPPAAGHGRRFAPCAATLPAVSDTDDRPPVAAPRRPRRLLRKLALALFVGLVSLEVGLRVFDVGLPMARIWRWHPTLGWTQNPNWTYDYTIDGDRVHNEFNALGFRDTEHARAKPPGTRRIVVLGDSFCEALQVDLEQTFFRLLEARLDARGDGDYETINLGVGDWGQAQQLLALRDIGLDFAPDLVICEVFPLNDLCNNTIELYGLGKSHNDVYRPYFVEQGGELVATWHDPWRQRLRRFSRVFLNAERAWLGLSWSLEPGDDAERWRARWRAAGFTGLEPLLFTYVPDAEQTEAIRRGWRTTERLLTAIATTCRERGIAFLGVTIAWETTVGAPWARFASHQPPPAMDPDYPDRRLAALFARLGAPLVVTRPVFEQHQDEYRPCRAGHLGPGGHRLVAEALWQAIEAHGLLR